MLVAHAIVALLLAGLSVGLLVVGLRVHGPWASTRALLLVLFLSTWAGGVWLAPFGPTIWSIYWLPFLLMAILTAILIAAIEPPRDRTRAERMERERELEMGLGVFFWILVGALVLAVGLRYL